MIFPLACLLAAVGVGLGAFGAHALKTRVDETLLATWHTAVLYHLLHAVALVAIGIWLRQQQAPPLALTASWFLVAGIVLFSGSLYALVLTGIRPLGAVTPFGGVALITGWVLLALAAWRGA